DGTLLPVILSGGVMQGKKGQPGNMVLIAKNATERHLAEQTLRKANEGLMANQRALKNMMYDMKRTHDELNNTQAQLVQSEKLASLGQLAAGVAHEINNPLSFITNNMEILGEYIAAYQELSRAGEQLRLTVDAQNWEEVAAKSIAMRDLEEKLNMAYISEDTNKLIEQSKNGADRIKRIVQDLKTFARKDEGQMELNNIEEIIDSVVNIVWNEIKYTSELHKEYGGLPLVRCNSQRLGQVIIALLVNASQAIKEKGIITVKTFIQGTYACVTIGDNGCGIPPKDLESIFNPFYTTKPVGIGTGLGLSISHEIVSRHDGLLEVDSTVGIGTTFTIKLPLSKSPQTRETDVPV
ncbi:MAG: PAS domain-containing sensor histidine kinase, partial [Candidatus Omnitrophica bacterium]|nr:PAS domain-containing sensor histidine kinase [Candidatus Omnitrophota bacterium]